MKKRAFWGPLAALAALYAVSVGLRMATDVRRYNRILEISDEESLAQKAPGLFMQIMSGERDTVQEWLRFLTTAPGDLARYLRMESM